MALAGGLAVGDRVVCRGMLGSVVGGPARAACIRLSVAVRYEDGRITDERVTNLELLVDDPAEDDEQYEPPRQADDDDEPRGNEPPGREQEMASQAMWAQPAAAQTLTPACFAAADAQEEAQSPESPESPEEQCNDARQGDDAPQGRQLFDEGTAGFGPDQAEAALRDKIYANYEDLRAAFRALDQSNNGFVTREDFFQAMGNIFLSNGFSEDDVYEVADRFDLNRDGYISYNEFVATVEGDEALAREAAEEPAYESEPQDDPRMVTAVELAIQKFRATVDQRYPNMRKAFMSFNTERRPGLSPQNFAKALTLHGLYLTPPELELAWSYFDLNGTGQINYADFCAVMTQGARFGNHLGRQMFM